MTIILLATILAFLTSSSTSLFPYAKATPILLYGLDFGFPKILKSVFGIIEAFSNPTKLGYSLFFSLASITAEAPLFNCFISLIGISKIALA